MTTVNWSDNAKERMKTLLRGGYKLREVVADLVDNSIDYGGENCTVHVTFTLDSANSKPYLCIRDNGKGISPSDIDQAMTTGSRVTDYDPGLNLGMFGIGMKNSSLSQGKMVTVISKAEGEEICIRRIDAEHILENDIWEIFTTHSGSSVAIKEYETLSNLDKGTTVLIENMHKVMNKIEPETVDDDMIVLNDELDAYLGMVFESYINGTTLKSSRDNSYHDKKLAIYLNGTEHENMVHPLDPFLSNLVTEGGSKFDTLKKEFKLAELEFGTRTFDVDCENFIIPHADLLDGQNRLPGIPENWRKRMDSVVEWNIGQGLYFYRNKRLITFGGWGGVIGVETHRVSSRVKLQIPSYPEASEYFELDPHKREMELPRGPRKKLDIQLKKRWMWHSSDSSRTNHSSRSKARKSENGRAYLSSQSRTTSSTRQAALPVNRAPNTDTRMPASRTTPRQQNNPESQVPANSAGNHQNPPLNTRSPPPEPCVNIVSKTEGPLMAITGNPIIHDWVIEINQNDPLYSKLIEKIRQME